jgi:hypothetical protein
MVRGSTSLPGELQGKCKRVQGIWSFDWTKIVRNVIEAIGDDRCMGMNDPQMMSQIKFVRVNVPAPSSMLI